jgi:hypothetical protein
MISPDDVVYVVADAEERYDRDDNRKTAMFH